MDHAELNAVINRYLSEYGAEVNETVQVSPRLQPWVELDAKNKFA